MQYVIAEMSLRGANASEMAISVSPDQTAQGAG